MTEPNDNLETRLASLHPRPVTASLDARIARASAPTPPTRTAVSLFWTTVAGGAIAASTILILLTAQSVRPVPPETIAVSNSPKPSNLTVLASADWRWGDDLNLNLNESRRLP